MQIWQTLQQSLPFLQSPLWSPPELAQQQPVSSHSGPIELSRDWQALGPWSIGTREAAWGADPLEYEGGFRNLPYDPDALYPGSLVPGAEVPWSIFKAQEYSVNENGSAATLVVNFGEVDWKFHQDVYGWAGLQWQAWARGFIDVSDSENFIALYTDNVLEFYVDGKPYFGGDFYAFRRAPPLLLLQPGRHQLDVRLIRDVRAMGAANPPSLEVRIEARRSVEPMEVAEDEVLIPDIYNGQFAGLHGSITLRNYHQGVLSLVGLKSVNENVVVSRFGLDEIKLQGGQSRPVMFLLELRNPAATHLKLRLSYRLTDTTDIVFANEVTYKLHRAHEDRPHKMTFLHPSGIVSYAMLRPPATNASCPTSLKEAPVLLALHGAGVEASWPMSTHSLDAVPYLCAWVLIPTGTTKWSGDDWHTWGIADVEAAIQGIGFWILHTKWKGVGFDFKSWLVAGHSNGGQGVWFILTHRPDKVIAAAPLSAYTSIQNYVPYTLWSYADPRQAAIVQASLNDFRHELLLRNARGIPILQQHGSSDDNVPVYHGRLMYERLHLSNVQATYSELRGKGHWFEGALTTDALKMFYKSQLDGATKSINAFTDTSLIVANPASMGSKNGLRVTHLLDPGQYGYVDFKTNAETGICVFNTSNIYAFELAPLYDSCHEVVVDGERFAPGASLFEKHGRWWGYQRPDEWQEDRCARCRRGAQLGGIDAVLRTRASFKIIHDTRATFDVALQISRNFLQYYRADSEIFNLQRDDLTSLWEGNVISVLAGRKFGEPFNSGHPIRFNNDGLLEIKSANGDWYVYEDAVAAIFVQPLRPLQNDMERVELVVWGKDVEHLQLAARLVPTLTGVGQSDFILLGNSCRWEGIGGVVAMGFFDHEWNITTSSWFS